MKPKKKIMKYDFKCDLCGRFINRKEFEPNGGASYSFVPDSDVSREENNYRCKKCTELQGQSHPHQSGMNWEVCCTTF